VAARARPASRRLGRLQIVREYRPDEERQIAALLALLRATWDEGGTEGPPELDQARAQTPGKVRDSSPASAPGDEERGHA